MIINGIEFPETVMTQMIGEQALVIDHLRFVVKERDTTIQLLTAHIGQLQSELDKKNG